MVVKLDIKDKKIINELWRNARQTDSAIAKKVGLSREVVSYRIKRLKKLGAIRNYITLVDTNKLGYITFHVYLRLQNFDKEKKKEIIEIIKSNPYVKWLISISGQYDLFFVMVAKSRIDFDTQLTHLYSMFEENVSESLILNTIKIYKEVEFFYPMKTLVETRFKAKKSEKIQIKDIDYEILHIISQNARMGVVEISKNLKKKLTPEAISYRLKKMQKADVIRGYRVVLDFRKLGRLWYMLLLNLRRIPKKLEMKLKEFFKHNKKTIYTDKTLGEWNIRTELLVKDHDEFHEELIKIRNLVSEFLNKYELILIFTDHTQISFTEGIYKDRFHKL